MSPAGTTCNDDGNACTADTCDGVSQACPYTVSVGAACDDGDPGTTGDVCETSATCAGTLVGEAYLEGKLITPSTGEAYGLPNVSFFIDGQLVTTEADGTFSVTVPARRLVIDVPSMPYAYPPLAGVTRPIVAGDR